MKFTDEQSAAIKKRNTNILVSAAAGSGKTAVLVERIIQKVIKDKVNIDDLLVVTFTNAAAAEMKERIISRIDKEIELGEEEDFLKEQLIRINNAQISTIDAFCLKVVKDNFKEIDIEHSFRIGDFNEIEILKSETLDLFLEEYYEKEENEFYEVLDAFSKKSDDTLFREIFLDIYEQSQNSSYPELWLEEAYNQYKIENEEDFFNCDIFKKLVEYSKNILQDSMSVKRYIDKLILNYSTKPEKTIDFLNEEFNQYKEAIYYLNEENFKGFYETIKGIDFKTFRITDLKDNPILKEEIKVLRDKIKKLIKEELQNKFFIKDIESILKENKKIFFIMQKFCSLIIEFDKYFLKIKKEKSIYTFNDISHFCLDILLNKEKNELSSVALAYKAKFNEIIIDEYQDSNLIQEEILSAISNNKNRFMVGDIKQCIYRFRQANPKIFNEKYLGYKNGELCGERIDLNANFRSSKNVIDSINFIFEKIMSKTLGEVSYDSESKLRKITQDDTETEDDNLYKDCELHIINTFSESFASDLSEELDELNRLEIEAHFIAKKIKLMVEEEKIKVLKNGEYLPIEYKDIVILSRGNSFSPIISKIFDEYKIPIFTKTNNGFFEITEISIILNILKIIDNPLQDIPLVSIMYSSIFNFSANELLEIKLKGNSKLYYHCVLNYIKNDDFIKDTKIVDKINFFLNKIKRWTKLSINLSINELLSVIYKESNYYNYVGVLKNGSLRQANLFNLLEKAILFEKSNLYGIFSFINYIEKIKDMGDKESESNIFSENENVVRVMTIHKSKGLEFPIVFLSELSKSFNISDRTGDILFDSDYKLGVSIKAKNDTEDDFSPRYIINSIQKDIIKEKIKRDCYSEELRILYVALTRAKEKLILVGSVNKKDFNEHLKKLDATISSEIINEKLILSSSIIKSPTYLSWVYTALNSFQDKTKWKIYTENKQDIISKDTFINNTFEENSFEKLFYFENTQHSKEYESIENSLNWSYPYDIDKNLETSLTVSEMKRKFENTFSGDFIYNITEFKNVDTENGSFDDATYNLPKFYKGKSDEISPLLKGTLYHTLFEHINININSLEQIDEFINNLQIQGIITAEEKNFIEKDKILLFLKSNLVKRIKNSNFVKKEMPFKLGVKPLEIYFNKDMKKSNSIIIVNGIIDLLFEENDEIILVDYKTDNVTSKEILAKRYKVQLDIYKKAIEKATGKKVKECILYLILFGKEIIIK